MRIAMLSAMQNALHRTLSEVTGNGIRVHTDAFARPLQTGANLGGGKESVAQYRADNRALSADRASALEQWQGVLRAGHWNRAKAPCWASRPVWAVII